MNLIGGDTHAARREFLSYCLSLMRAHNSEHLDSLPVLDVSALKHVAYVFDSLIYFMRSGDGNNMDNNEYRREGLSVPSHWHDQVRGLIVFEDISRSYWVLDLFSPLFRFNMTV